MGGIIGPSVSGGHNGTKFKCWRGSVVGQS